MNIVELITKIKEEHSSGNFTLQSIFNRNIEHIETMKSEGYTYKAICDKLDIGLSHKHFRGLVSNARKNMLTVPVEKKKPLLVTEKIAEKKETANLNVDSFDLSEWEKIGINNPRLIKNIAKAQLTPDEVKSWGCANEMQISKRVTEYLIKMNKKG